MKNQELQRAEILINLIEITDKLEGTVEGTIVYNQMDNIMYAIEELKLEGALNE